MDVTDVNFQIAYILTLITIVVKLTLSGILSKKYKDVETLGTHRLTFIMGMLLLIFGIGISRILFFILDFYLTLYDPSLVYVFPNILVWKFGMFCSILSLIPIVFVVERDVYEGRTKKIPTILGCILAGFTLFYPVNNEFDFGIVSTVSGGAMFIIFIIPVGFLYLASKTSGQLRNVSITISLSILVYVIASIFSTDIIIGALELSNPEVRTIMIIIVPFLKIISLIIAAYASVNFRT